MLTTCVSKLQEQYDFFFFNKRLIWLIQSYLYYVCGGYKLIFSFCIFSCTSNSSFSFSCLPFVICFVVVAVVVRPPFCLLFFSLLLLPFVFLDRLTHLNYTVDYPNLFKFPIERRREISRYFFYSCTYYLSFFLLLCLLCLSSFCF